jgi:hypothetical protein
MFTNYIIGAAVAVGLLCLLYGAGYTMGLLP